MLLNRNNLLIGLSVALISTFSIQSFAQNHERLLQMGDYAPQTMTTLDDGESLKKLKKHQDRMLSVHNANLFTHKLLYEVIKQEDESTKAHFIYSPLSLINVMHLLSEGSAGRTHNEINQAIWNKSTVYNEEREILSSWMKAKSPNDSISLWNANALWSNKNFPIKKGYSDLLKTDYNATIRSLDFSNPKTKDIINAWVNSNTNKLIPSIVEKTDPTDVLILTNAIYFKDLWIKPFEKRDTRTSIFFGESDNEQIPFMNGTQRIHYKEYEKYEEIGVPMKNDFVYYIILPKVGYTVKDILEHQVENKANWASSFDANKEVLLSMPKMKIEHSLELNNPLQRLGIRDIFNERSANFNKISDQKGLMVSDILQKVYLEISEEGAEGAAVTSATIQVTSMPMREEIKINRPFIYYIKNVKDNSTIFAGYITEAPL